MVVELHVLALTCYGGAAGLTAAPMIGIRRRRSPDLLSIGFGFSAAALHFAALLAFAREIGTLPLAGVAPALSSLAFLVGLIALGIHGLTREGAIQLVSGPIVLVLLALGLSAGFPTEAGAPAVVGPWFVAHVAASLAGLALLAAAFAAAALYLLQHRQLKRRRFGVIFEFFPPLEQLDRLNRLALLGGFPVLSAGVLLALAHAGTNAFETISSGKLVWGVFAWIVFGVIAGGRALRVLEGKRGAVASVLAFAGVAVAYVVVRGMGQGGPGFMP